MDDYEIDSWPAIPSGYFEEGTGDIPFDRVVEFLDLSEYGIYRLSDLVDGTFLEVPPVFVGLLLNTAADGGYEIGPAELMRYRSYFLGTENVEGKPHRVLWGVFGEKNIVDSFVLTDDIIVCKIIPSAATHPIEEGQRRTSILNE